MGRFDVLLPPAGPRSIVDPTGRQIGEAGDSSTSFDAILAGRLDAGGAVQFSPDAREVMAAQGIELSPIEMDEMSRAIDRLAQAGGREGLLVGEKGAFAVRVDDRTVVEVTPTESMRETVFTRIDSAVLLD